MSLDVYLSVPGTMPEPIEAVFIREGGIVRELSRSEWESRYPDHDYPNVFRGPTVFDADRPQPKRVYSSNITHNLGKMAAAAGIYQALWRPEEIGITRASQLIEPLKAGLSLLRGDPRRFEAFNAPNGWGRYEHFVPFVAEYLVACEDYPDAEVSVSR